MTNIKIEIPKGSPANSGNNNTPAEGSNSSANQTQAELEAKEKAALEAELEAPYFETKSSITINKRFIFSYIRIVKTMTPNNIFLYVIRHTILVLSLLKTSNSFITFFISILKVSKLSFSFIIKTARVFKILNVIIIKRSITKFSSSSFNNSNLLLFRLLINSNT
jgi:uncharacterized membrane protein